jgi:dihydrodipicolinate synthase/N-acetylneuraminate lyase
MIAQHLDRRKFFRSFGAAALAGGFTQTATAGAKPLRGVFPIGQTPFTESNKLDLDCLAAEVRLCNRGGVHGFVWPQIASGWTTLSEHERIEGAEAILAAAKGGQTAIVIGVQTLGGDVDDAVRLARHAAQHGADAIISLPPEKAAGTELIEYYRAIGSATELPLIAQTAGDVSVDLVIRISEAVPTLRAVKDEAGNPLARVRQIIERSAGELAVFSGSGVRTMIEEMRLGFTGHCPITGVADLYASAFDLWHSGKRKEAFDMFGRVLAFSSIPGANDYALTARGVFRETKTARGGMGLMRADHPLSEASKTFIREALNTFLKPYLRA